MLRAYMMHYPPVRRLPQPFKSAKQRAYFFAALAEGEIVVPYVRGGSTSQRIQARWTIEFESAGLVAVIGNNAEGAPYVYDAVVQSYYHRGNWQTDQQAVDELEPRIIALILEKIEREVGR